MQSCESLMKEDEGLDCLDFRLNLEDLKHSQNASQHIFTDALHCMPLNIIELTLFLQITLKT